ncbi:hypothetical protein [Spirillospora sp. CA-128828]|uniref:hypothetical protein n=1 Tax=Spirillospora sp. CA-128828 TaxID=3240033 RepID=UPI003D900C06
MNIALIVAAVLGVLAGRAARTKDWAAIPMAVVGIVTLLLAGNKLPAVAIAAVLGFLAGLPKKNWVAYVGAGGLLLAALHFTQ